MLQDRAAIGRVERHKYRAEIIDGVKGQKRLAAIGQPDRNMVVLLDTKLLQANGDGDGLCLELAIGPVTTVLEHGIDLVAAAFGNLVDQVAQNTDLAVRDAVIDVFRCRTWI